MAWLKNRKLMKRFYNVFLEKRFEGTWINSIYQYGDILYMNIRLPEQKDCSDLMKILPNLKQEAGAIDAKIEQNGKYVKIIFGMRQLDEINFHEDMLIKNSLKVQFPSAYGEHIIDFEDGSSCHMLNGGVTRMGKTCFLLYVATTIFLQNNGYVKFYISSAKLKDYYPFDGIPNVKMAKDEKGMIELLDDILEEYKSRNELLYSPQFRKATDAKSIREHYPEEYHRFQPIFLIIDEYARFAANRDIQDKVTEIVETAGFVNVHVIIASQRPDASTVLKPRIRANLLVRMAFTTSDRKNSEIILDREGAENLGRIPGRALLIDSDTHVIQVPYLDVRTCDELLEPYREEIEIEQEETGRIDNEVSDKIQSLLAESISILDLSGEFQSSECGEPCFETNVLEWRNFPNSTGTRQTVPLHAESDPNPSENGKNRPLFENS